MSEPQVASQSPRRVLHVMNSASGGAAVSTLDLITACRTAGIDSVVVCHEAGLPQDFERIRSAVDGRVLIRPLYWMNRKIRSPLWKRPAIELYQFWRAGGCIGSSRDTAEFAARHHVDLIHTNTILTPEGGRAARLLGLPHVWHVRELVGPGMPFRFYGTGRMLGRYLERQATLVVANSQVTASKLRDWVSPDVLRVVPNGIDVARFEERTSDDEVRPVVVAMVGNVTQWKKHDLFIKAAAAVDRNLSVEFRIYGHVPATPELRAPLDALIAQHGLGERFRLMGFVGDPRQIMSEIDVLVHTSDHESFGRVLVEGMAARLPIVSVRGGGASEIVIDGETGLLATPNSVSELAAHIEHLIRDAALRRRFGQSGRRRAEAEFSLDGCVTRMLAVYKEAMARFPQQTTK